MGNNLIVIIASGNRNMGSGHLARQYEVARLANENDFETWVIGELPLAWELNFGGVGSKVIQSGPSPSSQEILALTRGRLKFRKSTWLIRDNYSLEEQFDEAVTSSFEHYVIFDDVSRVNTVCELFFNQGLSDLNSDSSTYRFLNDGGAVLGPNAAVIRDSLHALQRTHDTRLNVKNLKGIVTLGYSDPVDFSSRIWDALPDAGPIGWDFILGPDYAGELVGGTFALHKRAFGLQSLLGVEYFRASLAMGAAGVSAYERAFCGLPSINFVLASNQLGVSKILGDSGCCLVVDTVALPSLPEYAQSLLEPSRWLSMKERGMELVDGKGASRLMDAIIERT